MSYRGVAGERGKHSDKEVALGRRTAEYMLRMSARRPQTETEVGPSELLALLPERFLGHL